jgi:hypothetical protein
MSSIQLVKEVIAPGIVDFPEPTGKIAYGFRYDVATGAFDVVRHDDGSFVKLSDDSIIRDDDYAQVVWSDKLLSFSWTTSYPGHLQVEIV